MTPPRPVRSRAPANMEGERGSDGGAACGAQASAVGSVRAPEARTAVQLVKFWQVKSPRAISRAGRSTFSDDVSMQVFCPTGQAVFRKHERTGMPGTSVKVAAMMSAVPGAHRSNCVSQ